MDESAAEFLEVSKSLATPFSCVCYDRGHKFCQSWISARALRKLGNLSA